MIESLSEDMRDAHTSLENSQKNLNTLKLFVVSAHPDKYNVPLASGEKLHSLDPVELTALSEEINQSMKPAQEGINKSEFDKTLQKVVQRHNIEETDLKSYINAIEEVGYSQDNVTTRGIQESNRSIPASSE